MKYAIVLLVISWSSQMWANGPVYNFNFYNEQENVKSDSEEQELEKAEDNLEVVVGTGNSSPRPAPQTSPVVTTPPPTPTSSYTEPRKWGFTGGADTFFSNGNSGSLKASGPTFGLMLPFTRDTYLRIGYTHAKLQITDNRPYIYPTATTLEGKIPKLNLGLLHYFNVTSFFKWGFGLTGHVGKGTLTTASGWDAEYNFYGGNLFTELAIDIGPFRIAGQYGYGILRSNLGDYNEEAPYGFWSSVGGGPFNVWNQGSRPSPVPGSKSEQNTSHIGVSLSIMI